VARKTLLTDIAAAVALLAATTLVLVGSVSMRHRVWRAVRSEPTRPAHSRPPPPPPKVHRTRHNEATAATEGQTDVLGPLIPVSGPAGSILLDPGQAIDALFHDCSEERAAIAASQLRPMNPVVRAQPLSTVAWRDLPSPLVQGSQDRMPAILAPAFRDRDPEVITLPTGHCPNWSRPEVVAELLPSRAAKIAAAFDQGPL
jgi:pimeloyl-ACP methyl ester carboxylesterase